MIKALMISLGLTTILAGPAAAEGFKSSPKAVLELFTSQGCSSCPPADEILSGLHRDPSLITLAYHVDYWDYIGWKDTFGSSAFSDLQRAYAQAQHKSGIYTPQLLVNGETDVVGSRGRDVNGAISGASLSVPVVLKDDAGILDVAIDGGTGLNEAAVWLVTFRTSSEIDIQRGENRGRKINYTQIVTGRQVLGMWTPHVGAHIRLPIAEILGAQSDGAAIIVQEDHNGLPGKMLGAASFTR